MAPPHFPLANLERDPKLFIIFCNYARYNLPVFANNPNPLLHLQALAPTSVFAGALVSIATEYSNRARIS